MAAPAELQVVDELVSVAADETVHVTTWSRAQCNLSEKKRAGANIVLVHHGIGEHAKRYEPFARTLLEQTSSLDIVVCYDIRRHGRNKGPPGAVAGTSVLAQDFSTVLEWLTSSYEHSNIVLVGHSLGGLVVAQASSDSSLTIHTNAKLRPRGVLLSAPAISIFVPGTINKILAPLVPLVVRIPGMETNTKASDLSASELSHDESVVKAYESDPLINNFSSFGIGRDFLSMGSKICRRVADDSEKDLAINSVPVLLLHGSEDTICKIDGTIQLRNAIKDQDKVSFVTVPNARHEMHNERPENGREEFFRAASEFLTRVFAKTSASEGRESGN